MSVLVYARVSDKKILKSSFEAVYYASKVAEKTEKNTTAVVIGDADNIEELGKYGANKILHFKSKIADTFDSIVFTKILSTAIDSENPEIIVFPYDSEGKAFASRISAKYEAGMVAGAIDYPDLTDGFVVKKNVFSGKAFANVKILTEKKIIALLPNSIRPEKSENTAEIQNFEVNINENDKKVKVLEIKKTKGKVPLTESEIVVSGGRGLKGPENWGMIEELAKELNAATSCSRPVADMGWRPHHEHVGQTGTTIRPNLYIAIGISGAIQHLAGVNGSKVIVVINKDPEAPFFKAADYGIVGDAFEVVPKLIDAVKKFKQN